MPSCRWPAFGIVFLGIRDFLCLLKRTRLSIRSARRLRPGGLTAHAVRFCRRDASYGYFKGREILPCHEAGIYALVPPTKTSNAKADGRFDKADFIDDPIRNEYRCPAGEALIYRFSSVERHDASLVLALELPGLRTQGQVHPELAAARDALGASGHARRHAGAS